MTLIKELMDWIQTFRKSLNKTLIELKVELKEVKKRLNKGIEEGYDDGELMDRDNKRRWEIPKEILIIEGKIGVINELEDNFKELVKKDLERRPFDKIYDKDSIGWKYLKDLEDITR